jgi:cytochrome c-type biogenesis protein CcmH/NrfG
MSQITLRQRKTELSKATAELEREKAALLIEKAEMQRKQDEFTATYSAAAREVKQKKLKEREEMWGNIFAGAAVFLVIPVATLGASLLVAEVVWGWRMFLWAIDTAGGHGGC